MNKFGINYTIIVKDDGGNRKHNKQNTTHKPYYYLIQLNYTVNVYICVITISDITNTIIYLYKTYLDKNFTLLTFSLSSKIQTTSLC